MTEKRGAGEISKHCVEIMLVHHKQQFGCLFNQTTYYIHRGTQLHTIDSHQNWNIEMVLLMRFYCFWWKLFQVYLCSEVHNWAHYCPSTYSTLIRDSSIMHTFRSCIEVSARGMTLIYSLFAFRMCCWKKGDLTIPYDQLIFNSLLLNRV